MTQPYVKKQVTKLPMLDINTLYSITINPDNTRQYYHDPVRIDKTINRLKKTLDTCSLHYNLYMEISQPSDTSREMRVHAHGIIEFHNYGQLKQWYTRDFSRIQQQNYLNIDTIADIAKWQEYCHKNHHIMKHLTKQNQITSYNHPEFLIK